jgi:hypothetical protein
MSQTSVPSNSPLFSNQALVSTAAISRQPCVDRCGRRGGARGVPTNTPPHYFTPTPKTLTHLWSKKKLSPI